MNQKNHKLKIGLVMSAVPGYSETFFRNKIKGLQNDGFEVVLFVDYIKENDMGVSCKVIGAKDFNKGKIWNFINSCSVILKSVFTHPKESYRLFLLDKKDGVPFDKRIKNLILNEFLLTQKLNWLHFGFGMLAKDRENVAEAIGAKMAVSFRGYDLYLSPLKHPGCYDSLFQKKVKYHVLSEEMKQTLLGYTIDPKFIEVITPAIDTRFFQKHEDVVPRGVITFITVARLHWKKGLEYTLEALAHLKNQGLQFRYIIIGEGAEKERLVYAAHQLGLSSLVHFKGKLSSEEIKAQLAASSLYLQYSIQEGFCNAVLEAQAMGLLCIVSNAEGLSENVVHEHTGWVVQKRHPKLLAQKILEVLKLSETAQQKIREAAVKRVRQDFTLAQQQEKFNNFYRQ